LGFGIINVCGSCNCLPRANWLPCAIEPGRAVILPQMSSSAGNMPGIGPGASPDDTPNDCAVHTTAPRRLALSTISRKSQRPGRCRAQHRRRLRSRRLTRPAIPRATPARTSTPHRSRRPASIDATPTMHRSVKAARAVVRMRGAQNPTSRRRRFRNASTTTSACPAHTDQKCDGRPLTRTFSSRGGAGLADDGTSVLGGLALPPRTERGSCERPWAWLTLRHGQRHKNSGPASPLSPDRLNTPT